MRGIFLLILGLGSSAFVHAAARIEAAGELAADTRDSFGDTVGGIGSGLIYDAAEDVYLCQPDRGPGDGTLPFRPRFVEVKLTQSGDKLSATVVKSVLYRDEQGRTLTGLIPDDESSEIPKRKDGRTCLDPEALALAPDGTLYVSDEYGPFIYQFRRDGSLIRRIQMPEAFRPRDVTGKLEFGQSRPLASGRNVNQGGEGMALMPDGKSMAVIFQSGLVQDGGHKSPTTHLLILDLESGEALAEYRYTFAQKCPETGEPLRIEDLSVNDLVVLDEKRFLVLERDGRGRNGTNNPSVADYKSVWVVDISKATDVLHSKTREIRSVEKTLLYNLPALVNDPAQLSAKWEGIARIPPREKNSVTLMMSADNDFLTPTIHDEGETVEFPRVKKEVPTQFFKIWAELPK